MQLPKLRSLRKSKHGTISFALVFIFLFVITCFTFAVAIPMTLDINTAFFSMGEDMLQEGLEHANNIQDNDVKDSVTKTLTGAKDSFSDQVDILGFFVQYAWVFIVIIILFIIVIAARKQVESEIT